MANVSEKAKMENSITSGTREWASSNVNLISGCSNDCRYCISPDTLILMEDLNEKKIKDIRIGDTIIGVSKKENGYRQFDKSIVLNKWETTKEAFKIVLEDKTTLICSKDHRWLTNRGWKYTTGEMKGSKRRPYLTSKNHVMKLYDIGYLNLDENEMFKRGYLCGMIKGDGLLKKYDYSHKQRTIKNNGKTYIRTKDVQYHFRLAVRDKECLLRTKRYLEEFGIITSDPYIHENNIMAIRTNKKEDYIKIKEIIQFRENEEFYRGFVSGFYDAEGNVDTSCKSSMRVSNKNLDLIEFYEKSLLAFNFSFRRELNREDLHAVRLLGGRAEKIKFLQFFNPSITKMKTNAPRGTLKPLKSKIKEIIPLNKKINMIDIETTTGNFIANGCISHNCYAKKMAIRFGRKTEETWKEMTLNKAAVHKNYKKRKGRIMFPSSHDITREHLKACAFVLKKMLSAGNEVLITTKPDLTCIYKLLSYLKPYKSQVQFRFTITSKDPKKLKFWEPGAPGLDDRLQSLKLARMKEFKTSVSIEPFLDKTPIPLILMLSNDVTETIWVGKMNYIKSNDLTPEEEKYYDFQRKICSWSNIQEILSQLQKLPDEIKSKIRIKDSIRKMYEKRHMEVTL